MKNKLYILLGVIAILTMVFATGFTSKPMMPNPGGPGGPGGPGPGGPGGPGYGQGGQDGQGGHGGDDKGCKDGKGKDCKPECKKDHPCPKPTAVVPVDPCPPQNKNVGSCESDYHRLHIPHPSGGLNWLQGIWAQLTSQTWWPKF